MSAPRHAKHGRVAKSRNIESVSFTPSVSLEFASKKKHVRKPSQISNVAPSAESRANAKSKKSPERLRKVSLAEEGLRKTQRKRRISIISFVLVASILAVSAGVFMYFKTTDKNLELTNSNARNALVTVADDQPFYVLCTADLSESHLIKPSSDDKAIMLVRVDKPAKKLTFVSIPSRLSIKFPDNKSYAIGEYPKEMGDAALISAVSTFADVPITHFVTTNAEQIRNAVEKSGGIDVEINTEIDDPTAGYKVIDAGAQSLDADEAMTFLRAQNIQGAFSGTANNRVNFITQLLSAALRPNGLGLATVVSDAANYIHTDWNAGGLLSTAEAFQPFEEATIYQCVVPYTKTTSVDDGSKLLSCNTVEWGIMREVINSGADPKDSLTSEGASTLRNFKVEIRNGASIDLAASELSDKLKNLGYKLGEVGNTYEGIIYPDTLVIYTKPEHEESAKTVIGDISQGRLVNGGDFYQTKSDVLVIIGADWIS